MQLYRKSKKKYFKSKSIQTTSHKILGQQVLKRWQKGHKKKGTKVTILTIALVEKSMATGVDPRCFDSDWMISDRLILLVLNKWYIFSCLCFDSNWIRVYKKTTFSLQWLYKVHGARNHIGMKRSVSWWRDLYHYIARLLLLCDVTHLHRTE